jgi:hypothetical protein
MFRRLLLTAVLSLVFLGVAAPASARADVQREETTTVEFNSCNGDLVHLVIRLQTVIPPAKPDGSQIINVHVHGTGVGQPSGLKYTLTTNNHTVFAPGGAEQSFRQRLISQGSADNQVFIIIDRNGHGTFEFECRG